MPTGKKKIFTDPVKRKKHEASLAKRREKHREARTIEMAKQAAEGQSDWETLVEAERVRQDGHFKAMRKKGASTSPKILQAARENLASAFDLMGGVAALVVWGRQNPTDFYRLWAKLVPSSAAVEHSASIPLEELLSKLSSKEEKSVAQAASEVGDEILEQGHQQAMLEDLSNKPTLN
jgi:hypothetical protein